MLGPDRTESAGVNVSAAHGMDDGASWRPVCARYGPEWWRGEYYGHAPPRRLRARLAGRAAVRTPYRGPRGEDHE